MRLGNWPSMNFSASSGRPARTSSNTFFACGEGLLWVMAQYCQNGGMYTTTLLYWVLYRIQVLLRRVITWYGRAASFTGPLSFCTYCRCTATVCTDVKRIMKNHIAPRKGMGYVW